MRINWINVWMSLHCVCITFSCCERIWKWLISQRVSWLHVFCHYVSLIIAMCHVIQSSIIICWWSCHQHYMCTLWRPAWYMQNIKVNKYIMLFFCEKTTRARCVHSLSQLIRVKGQASGNQTFFWGTVSCKRINFMHSLS